MKHIFLLLVGFALPAAGLAQALPKQQPAYTYQVNTGIPGKQVFISGSRPFDAKGNLVGAGDLAAQTRQVFANLTEALSSVGMTMQNVTQVTYHLKGESGTISTQQSQQVANIGATFFGQAQPGISETKSIPKIISDDVLLEVEVIAVK